MVKNAYGKLLGLFFQDKKKSGLMLILMIASSIFAAMGPKLLGNLTDVVTAGAAAGKVDWNTFLGGAGILAFVYIGQFVTKWIAGWLSARITSDISYKLRQDVEQKFWKLPLKYYDTHQPGAVMSIVSNDVDNIISTLNQTGGDLIYNALMLLGMIVMMALLSWKLSLVTLVLMPLSAWFVKRLGGFSKSQYKKQWMYTGQINANVEESCNGFQVMKSLGLEEEFLENFREQNRRLYSASFRANVLSNAVNPFSRFFTNINYVIVALVGALGVIRGTMTIGGVQAFIQYTRQFQQPFSKLASMFSTLQSGAVSLERVYELLNWDEEQQEEDLLYENYRLKGQIDFCDVSFSYVPEKKLIEHMDLHVKPGEMVAIVGGTGAGKTTLINLIERFYEINGGEILLDGNVPLDKIGREALRENLGMVLQDTWLYTGTIRENLCYGLPDNRKVSEEEFLAACRDAFVDQFVSSLPEGYDTLVSNDATAVSAGEKQLLTIARTFLRKPNVLILDEATSSVDTRTEALIQEALNRLREGRTSFVIAHRLSTIRNADIILVMDKGHIVEQGSHSELLAKNGVYAQIYRSQF